MATPRPITFLSDYGYEDEFAGICRAVISQIAPGAPLIDLTHGVARQNVRQGAIALANALPSCPPGVHLAVVDPGVGSDRRAVAVAAVEGRFLVGPDNGLLSRAIDRLGGALDAVELSRSPFRLEPVSATFHGRDLFAPVAAHLSLGARLEEAGKAIDPASLTALELPVPKISENEVVAHAIHQDSYGNVTLDLDAAMLADGPIRPGDALEVRAPDGRFQATWARTFADVGPSDVLLFEDSSGTLALAVNGGSAAGLLDPGPRPRGHAAASEVTVELGRPHRHHRRIDSTNELAKQLAMAGAPAGLVVTADEQSAGRGRRGNAWFAPAGSCLLYSALVRPFAADRSPLLPLAVPIAVCETAEALAPVRCQVKWPNDVWIDEQQGVRRTRRGPPGRGLGRRRGGPQRRHHGGRVPARAARQGDLAAAHGGRGWAPARWSAERETLARGAQRAPRPLGSKPARMMC